MPIPGPYPTSSTPGGGTTTPPPGTTPGTTPGAGGMSAWWLALMERLGITPGQGGWGRHIPTGDGTGDTEPPAGGYFGGGGKGRGGWWGPGAYSSYASMPRPTTPAPGTPPAGGTPGAGAGPDWWKALLEQLGDDPTFPARLREGFGTRAPVSGGRIWGLGSGSIAGSAAAGSGSSGSGASSLPTSSSPAAAPAWFSSWFR